MSVPTSRLIHLPVICGYLYTMTAELSSCYRDCKLARLKYLLSGSSKEKIPGKREWLPTPVLLPGKFHEQRSWEGYSPGGGKDSDTTKQLTAT